MNRRVVVTGIGPVTSIGIGKREFFDHLLSLKIPLQEIPAEHEKKYRFRSRFFVPFPDFHLSQFVETRFESVMEKTSHLSVAGAKLALQDASLPEVEQAVVIMGVGISSLQTAFKSHIAHSIDKTTERFNRMVIPMMMTNAAAAWVSILFGIKGPAYTLNASCASGTYAIGETYGKIARGECDTALAGGVECLEDESGSIMRGFDMMNVLTTAPDGFPRPFTKNRSGFLFSEGGGCVLVLEELEKARLRGAHIYAEIAGFECNSDAHNILQMEASGSNIVSLLEKLIGNQHIDYLNTHGTGTHNNDETEARVIQKMFGDMEKQPLINSTKGLLGHSIGASGAIEAAVVAMSLSESRVHGNIINEPMENLNLTTKSVSAPIRNAVSLSFGFGGHNAGLFFKRFEES